MPFREPLDFFLGLRPSGLAKLSHNALLLDPEAAGRSPKMKAHPPRKGIAASAHQVA